MAFLVLTQVGGINEFRHTKQEKKEKKINN